MNTNGTFVEFKLPRRQLQVLNDLAEAMDADISTALSYLIEEHEQLVGEIRVEADLEGVVTTNDPGLTDRLNELGQAAVSI